jgi:ATP/maltotriose-dependent transcriptional regulator MalT
MQQLPLLQTKLFIPPIRPELVSRPRLIKRLDAALPALAAPALAQDGFARALTLISAPAGFGKTTLVSDWLHSRGAVTAPSKSSASDSGHLRVAWLSLDERDNDLARFLAYMIIALRSSGTIGADWSSGPEGLVLSTSHSHRKAIDGPQAGLDKGMLAALQSPQPPPADAVLTALINDLASLSGRIILVLDDFHLICDAVRFGKAESPSTADGDAVRFGRTESPSTPAGAAARPYPSTAPPERDSGQDILEALDRANLFVVPLDNERRWYRYHHLFRDLLRQRLASSVGDKRLDLAELRRRASIWCEENGFAVEAFHHAAAANDIERATHLIEGGGKSMTFRGALAPVLKRLKSLPARVLDANPLLWITYSAALLAMGQGAGVETKLQAAEVAIEASLPDFEGPVQSSSPREVALQLFVSLNTVKAHTRNIYGKLDVHSRTQAVARARGLGVLPDGRIPACP